jgi:hypothetical protein
MTNENEHAAAVSAAEGEATTDAVVHPTDPPQPIEPVPAPNANVGDPSVEEIEELRAEALADDDSPSDLDIPAGDLGPDFDEVGEVIDVRESALEHLEIEIPVNVIPPTVGRKVWFRKYGADLEGQPEDATIVYVHSDHMVNLFVVSPNGEPRGETSIPLVHEGEERPESGHFAEWMPFQKGQARPAFGIPIARQVVVGDDVYYGRGDSNYYAAKVTDVHDDRSVDLVVFESERVHHVFKVAKADLDQPGCINGWAFKA